MIFESFPSNYSGSAKKFDLCIIGAGPAGISIAHALRSENKSICVLEAGGRGPGESQALYKGQVSIRGVDGDLLKDYPEYLLTSRLRAFGGTSNHWTNWCRPFTPSDFARRDWIPYTGWPVSREEMQTSYERAADYCGVPLADPVDESQAFDFGGSNLFESLRYHINPRPVNFGKRWGSEFEASEDVSVFLNSPVIRVETSGYGTSVDSVVVVGDGNREFHVQAGAYVLATGGIENARLLLEWTSQDLLRPTFDEALLGAFFSDHLHVNLGFASLFEYPAEMRERYNALASHPEVLVFHFTDAAQREYGLMNSHIDFDPIRPPAGSQTEEALLRLMANSLDSRKGTVPETVRVRYIMEQAPNPKSRVTLSTSRDALGLRRTNLQWRFQERDVRAMKKAMELISRELGTNSAGRVRIDFTDAEALSKTTFDEHFAYYGYHHLGTTRMHESSKYGVVDQNCRIHGVENLYVGGSSIFTTAGHAPPTLTLVAFALRLSEYLKGNVL